MSSMWAYGETANLQNTDLAGFEVEAIDGGIGKVDEASHEVGSAYLVIDTGPWIFGKKVMVPAGIVDRVDLDEQKVYVHRTKDEIKNAPELDETRMRDERYRDDLGGYYGEGGAGYREPLSGRDRDLL